MKFHFTLKFHTAKDHLEGPAGSGGLRGGSGGAPGGLRGGSEGGSDRGGGSGVAPGEALGAARGAATPTRGPTQQGRGSDYMYSVSVSLVQQHPGVVGSCRSRVVVVEVELVVLPPIKPLGPIGPSSIVDHHGSLRDAREHPVHGRLHIVTGPHSAANSHSWQLKLSAAATLVAAL